MLGVSVVVGTQGMGVCYVDVLCSHRSSVVPGMEAPERGEGCPEAVGLHGKAAAEALQSGAERVRRELQAGEAQRLLI